MSEIKRYSLVTTKQGAWPATFESNNNGEYVRHEDYAALKDERDDLQSRLDRVKATAHDFDWERQTLKDERDSLDQANDRQAAYIERLLFVIESEGLSVPFPSEEADAALAEIRAQAVEGFASVIGKLCQSEKINSVRYRVAKHIVFLAVSHAASIRAAAKGEGVSK